MWEMKTDKNGQAPLTTVVETDRLLCTRVLQTVLKSTDENVVQGDLPPAEGPKGPVYEKNDAEGS